MLRKFPVVVGMVFVAIGIIVVIGGLIPIPYPKVIQQTENVIIDVKSSIQPTELDFILEAETRKNITYSLKNGTYLYMGLLKSDIDFYITDSVGNILLNEDRVTGEHSFVFTTPRNNNYTLCFDNIFDKVNNKTISYRLYEANYIAPKIVIVDIIYFEWNPWFLLLGQAVFFFGAHLTFQKRLPWVVAFLCGLLANFCSLFLFGHPDWFIVSLFTLLPSNTFLSYKLNNPNPDVTFKILFASTIAASAALLGIVATFPATVDLIVEEERFIEIIFPIEKTGATIILLVVFPVVATIFILASITLSFLLKEKLQTFSTKFKFEPA